MEKNIRKKTYLLPQHLIDQVRKAMGAKSETEVILKLMTNFLFQDRVVQWHQKNAGKLKIRNVYDR